MSDHDGQRGSRDSAKHRRHRRDEASPLSPTGPRSDQVETSADAGRSPPAREQLAAQARAAAEQAVQLARLAEQSARLALRLNEQAFGNEGPSRPQSGLWRPGHESKDSHGPPAGRHGPEGTFPQILTADGTLPKQTANSRTAHARHRKSMLVSTGLHFILLLLLASATIAVSNQNPVDTILASFAEEQAAVEDAMTLVEPVDEPGEQPEEPSSEETFPDEPPPEEMPSVEEDQPEAPPPPEERPPDEPPRQEPPEAAAVAQNAPPVPGPNPQPPGGADPTTVDLAKVGSRSEAGKALLLQRYGGTPESESAVQRALEWFASRQRQDGSWNFNDIGPCTHPGDADNPMGATAYVLLCYLGAGQTHQTGEFKKNVRAGLTYLLSRGRRVPAGGDFRGPNCREHDNFYVQAAVATVLSEAYAMTRDRRLGLRQASQLAADFLANAQDPVGGGWRYEPRTAGCTSVTALVTMALKSTAHAGLQVPPQVLERISLYLDTVRSDQAPTGRYGYRAKAPAYRSSTTAMALLCRMQLGWGKDNEELQKGIAILDKRGPYDNLYYCYYATQVMRHWGGDPWKRWNPVMRDDLVRTQGTEKGPEFGSWTPRDRSGPSTAGGRLFITCLATMTLEVYYRYLPLYGLPDEGDLAADGPVDAGPVDVAAEND